MLQRYVNQMVRELNKKNATRSGVFIIKQNLELVFES